MYKVEVLLATMHQRDFSKYHEMNIQTDAFIANQSDRYEYQETQINGHRVRMVTTNLTGLSQNRNIALLHAAGDICFIADEDVRYRDGYEKVVVDAYKECIDADIIIFNVFNVTHNVVSEPKIARTSSLRFYQTGFYNSIRITFRRTSILRSGLWFHTQFGAGNTYKSGEESLFLRQARNCGLKMYLYPNTILDYSSESSTWYTGMNKEYFYNRGAWIEATFSHLKLLIALSFMIKLRKVMSIGLFESLSLMLEGMRGFRKGISYEERTKHCNQ